MRTLLAIVLPLFALAAGKCGTEPPPPAPPVGKACADYSPSDCPNVAENGKKCRISVGGLCEEDTSAPIVKQNCSDYSQDDCAGAVALNGKKCVFFQPNPFVAGSCVEQSADKCSDYPPTEPECQGKFNLAGKTCDVYFDASGPICSEQRRKTCFRYSPADCVNAKNEAGYDCVIDAAGQCGNAPRDKCAEFPNDQCDQFARLNNGNGCELQGTNCVEVAVAAPVLQPNCGDYKNAIHCAQKTTTGKDCIWDLTPPGTCKDKIIGLANCKDYTPVNCVGATPQSGKSCKIGNKSGNCIDTPVVLIPYYRKQDGKPLIRNNVYNPPVDRGVSSYVHCLEANSRFFRAGKDGDDDVNQVLFDLSDVVEEPIYLYRWGEYQYECQRTNDGCVRPLPTPPAPLPGPGRKCLVPQAGPGVTPYPPQPPTFQLIRPYDHTEFSTAGGGLNRGLDKPCAANGSGAAVYGAGPYAAKTPFASIGYASPTPQTFSLDIKVQPGVTVLDGNRVLPSGITVSQELAKFGLSTASAEFCNPPSIYETGVNGWVVIKDPIGMDDTVEFSAREFKENNTCANFKNSAAGGDYARTYLLNRASLTGNCP